MRQHDIERAKVAECAATILFAPWSEQSLNGCAKHSEIERFLEELQRTALSASGGDLRWNRSANHQSPRVRMRAGDFFQKICQTRPWRIDIENKKLGPKLGCEFFCFRQRPRDCAEMFRREFF